MLISDTKVKKEELVNRTSLFYTWMQKDVFVCWMLRVGEFNMSQIIFIRISTKHGMLADTADATFTSSFDTTRRNVQTSSAFWSNERSTRKNEYITTKTCIYWHSQRLFEYHEGRDRIFGKCWHVFQHFINFHPKAVFVTTAGFIMTSLDEIKLDLTMSVNFEISFLENIIQNYYPFINVVLQMFRMTLSISHLLTQIYYT